MQGFVSFRRGQRKDIKKLYNDIGEEVTDVKGIQHIILTYFRSLFDSIHPTPADINEALDGLEHRMTATMNMELTKPFTAEEVTQALKQMHPLKSPGPDVAYELNHYLKHKNWGRKGHVSLKLDVSKAYDRVEWGFLESVLLRLGFDRNFVARVMTCVTTKSAIVFSKFVGEADRKELASILGVTEVPKHNKYLGLPTVSGRSKKELFEGIKERIWQKLNSWSSKKLSQGGRSVLLKRLKEYNNAFLAKQAWRVSFSDEGLLQSILKHKYFLNSTLLDARIGSSPSLTWRSLWNTRDLLVAGLRWRVRDGKSIPIKGQPWLPRPGTFQLIGQHANLAEDTKVVALITLAHEWDAALIRSEMWPIDSNCILSIRLRETGALDELIWHFERSGKFIVKSAYQVARGLRAECSCPGSSWAFIWKSKVPPKIALFG
ncbi:UNVERIFIED_CONTAM: hypothetical protein Slati_1485000 [Sesamum latifolium]|uniref:Reverse transcriptase domain-containing protein n=1 Tax=Sesamum latifolium TaxID=2727402 RepID=A0AAW2X6M8_9LAMI